jgi:FkbM family methyltransferase
VTLLARRLLEKGGRGLFYLGRRLHPMPQEQRVEPWRRAQGDKTLRLEYPLEETSLVLDVGGYQGQWASDIFAMYRPTIHIIEPVREFAEAIRRRFQANPRIKVHAVGLAGATQTADLSLNQDGSSIFLASDGDRERIRLVKASDFFEEQGLNHIDLIKINIEGGEYDLLEHLLDTGWVRRMHDIQVQFHDFVPKAEARMARLQRRLSETHTITYQYPFVWENWRLRA